ncbi:Lysine-specific demethylase 2B [Cytospora mali]|uniref:Lysine-specific demethylase 2B n=1 Tax=Cytospora mali TaxID=578113 RepID=A0A194VVR0_CYTMA|nr:Lysine-specific demethylase 2B [Valsa mali]
MRMRTGAVSMNATPPAQYAHETPPIISRHTSYRPSTEEYPRATVAADHPTVSTSSDELLGRHSDVFSVGEHSDTTITDPQIEQPEALPHIPLPPRLAINPNAQGFEDMIPTPPQTESMNGPSQHSFQNFREPSILSAPPMGIRLVGGLATEPSAQSGKGRPYDPLAPITPVNGQQCYCRAVPRVFLSMLDEGTASDIGTLAKLYGACRDDLCSLHLNSYAKLVTSAVEVVSAAPPPVTQQTDEKKGLQQMDQIPYTFDETGTGTKWTAVPRRRRATSVPGIDEIELDLSSKRRRLNGGESLRPLPESLDEQNSVHLQEGQQYLLQPEAWAPRGPYPLSQREMQTEYRPQLDMTHDQGFRRKVLAELAENFTDLKEDDWSRGETTNRYIYAILSKCQHPNTDVRKGPVDIGFLGGNEASTILESGTERLPIVTAAQQQFRWRSNERPIAQLFRRMEDLSRHVSVQIPSHNFDLPSYETKSLNEIRERFLRGEVSRDPWNILDLRSPLPPSILPSFLTGENCQLLPRIRDSLLEGHCAERIKASKEEWNEWTELLEWVLMSEGGHNTAPHMDSHGWSTWITIQEGNFGFGWLSRPTEKEQEDWMKDPLAYTGGNWRFVILKPGQTVFFPSGTVHFVFRLHAAQTLALGGHLLQWTALERWVQVILWQLKNPNITNEDLGTAPLKYIRSARKLVENRMTNYRVTSMGGMPTVTRFMALATEVERWYQKKKKKRSK